MINPTDEDKGRRVIYNPGYKTEHGIIKSFNESWVFVRYHDGDTGAATRRDDLFWATNK